VNRSNWKRYQAKLKRSSAQKRRIKNVRKYLSRVSLLLVGLSPIIGAIVVWSAYHHTDADTPLSKAGSSESLIDKRDVHLLLAGKSFENLENKSFEITFGGSKYRVDTSLEIPLQQFLLERISGATARYIGIVILDPHNGRILSLVNHDKTDSLNNLCLESTFPAASIFKIITAAAAIETRGFKENTALTYNGRKHTLYKSQLKERITKYTHRVTFTDSFAQSVNPVFGKIGAFYLGKLVLDNYAHSFGFNRIIDFEIPLLPSRFTVKDDPYQLAEIACGFNRRTIMSPLHGALIAAAVLNRGRIPAPTIIDQIQDEDHKLIYRNQFHTIGEPMVFATTLILQTMMVATIKSGTLRKAFKGHRRDKVLSKLYLGGKTGSIDNQSHDARFDWFVGFAREKKGSAKIVLSVFVAHEKNIGRKASYYARQAIKAYFGNYYAAQKTALKKQQT